MKYFYYFKKTLFICLLFVFCSNLFLGCKEQKNNSKILVLGTSADYPPFESMQQGEYVGFDIDLAKAITKELGYELEIKDMDFVGLIPALNGKIVDFVISAMNPGDERKQNVDFSDIYYQGPVTIVSKNDSKIHSFEDLQNLTLGVQLGSVWEIYAKSKTDEIKGLKIFTGNRIPQLVEELKVGRIDAIMIEKEQAIQIAKQNKKLNYTILDELGGGYVIAFAKDSELKDKFNGVIAKLQKNGGLDKIKKQWLD
jgi:ABC-type amino acid transport substrate-binding protein